MHYYAIDLESFTFSGAWKYASLTSEERRRADNGAIVRHVEQLLELLRACGVKLTFFAVGEIHDWYPELLESIRSEGHEVAWHTHRHTYLYRPAAIAGELDLSRDFIKAFGIRGFQAPAIVMNRADYPALAAAGIRYSSSVYSALPPYGVEGVLEVPVSTRPHGGRALPVRYPAKMGFGMLARELPFGSSLYLKVLGWKWISRLIRETEKHGRSANLFVHNWQLFDEPRAARVDRLWDNLRNPLTIPYRFNVREEFTCLLKEHEFGRLDGALRDAGACAPSVTGGVPPRRENGR